MRLLCGALGVLMFFGGVLLAATSAGMKTTVGDTHNIGLIGKQQADTTFYSGIAVAGAVLLGSAGVIEAVNAHGRRADERDEKESKDREAMLRRLDVIANSQAAPPRPATAKLRPDFDAVVAAEMSGQQPPRPKAPPLR